MTCSQLFCALFLLVSPAFAFQSQCGGVSGVSVEVTPAVVTPGQPVRITLTNESNETLTMRSCIYSLVVAGSDCQGTAVAQGACNGTVIYYVQPGQRQYRFWHQTDWHGIQVPTGDYSFVMTYSDGSGVHQTCCATVTVGLATGVSFCYWAYCPCGPQLLGPTGCQNATGLGAWMTADGESDVSNDSVTLNVLDTPPLMPGVFFSSPSVMTAQPFGAGLRCVGNPITRLGVTTSDSQGRARSTGSLSGMEGLLPGDTRNYQYWYRDAGNSCAEFNVSNAHRIFW